MKRNITTLTLILGMTFGYTFGQVCAPPTSVDIIVDTFTLNITLNGADTTWEKCEFQVRELGSASWKRARINVPPTPVSLTVNVLSNLDANTSYELRTRCACSLSPLSVSPFGGIDTFTTGDTPDVRKAIQPIEIAVYPNPATEFVNMVYNSTFDATLDVEVYDLAGRTVISETYDVISGPNAIRVNLEGVDNGSYFIRVTDGTRERVEPLSITKN